MLQRKISWYDIWQAELQRIMFMVQAMYNVIPSQANLHIWGMNNSSACPLCRGRGSLERLLSSCPVELGEGRYCWQHDQVLKAVAEAIAKFVKTCRHNNIIFVKAGKQLKSQPKQHQGCSILHPIGIS